MFEKSKLKLQIPSHRHTYDLDYSEDLEAPSGIISSNHSNLAGPIQRKRLPKHIQTKGIVPVPNNEINETTMTVPKSPTSPDMSSAFYPSLRLHRETSCSSPDMTKFAAIEHIDVNKNIDPIDQNQNYSAIDAYFSSNGQNLSFMKSSLIEKCKNDLKDLRNSSESTVAKQVSHDNVNGGNGIMVEMERKLEEIQSKSGSNYNLNSESSMDAVIPPPKPTLPKRHSIANGFISSLLFGQHMVEGKPLKVSAFDVSMCAPGSM